MATRTLGTITTTALTAIQRPPTYTSNLLTLFSDVPTMNGLIWNDALNPQAQLNHVNLSQSLTPNGLLYVPNRGVLRVYPGDWVAVDAAGWPVLIGRESLPQTLTVTGTLNSTTAVTGLSANVLAQGWWAGMPITGTNVGSNNFIKAIAPGGLSLTLLNAATGGGSQTLTAGAWTHS